MSRILLLGKGGQLGATLLPHLQTLGTVTALGRDQLELSQSDQIAAVVADYQPEVIINAAAYTAVDRAETEAELAQRVNGDGPGKLAASAAAQGARLLHISTDYVFNGHQGQPWQEGDDTQPLSVYGRTKLAGEQAVRAALPEAHWILRTAWVYGTQGQGNFVKTMVRLGQTRKTLRVVQDQVGSPTWVEDLAAAVVALVRLGDRAPAGTYHYTNSGVASWYDFAIAIFEEARALGLPLAVQTVQPIPTCDYPTPAHRPAYSVLDCQKITALLGHPAPHWRESLRIMLKDYLQTLAKEVGQ
ncbi:dTDP-4-dehydrorhamnose reductase [Leptolyngbya sp. PCC 6406]|uniref:dTDP-4-dehydrorhamnose reductase n=1 Tax=Leptolyngbya sp. PCC 6406 TaxID=1173264 RepID=UPI0002ABE7FA|nr:dTDP-4-dehydrorhamnose reductase [Leptolyngbya sp. PCC 6406]